MTSHTNLLLCAASVLAWGSLISTTHAADAVPVLEQSKLPEQPKDQPPLYRPLTLGLDVGALGFGGSVSWRFSDHFGARVGLDYISFTDSDLVVSGIHYDAKFRLLGEPVTFDIYPWKTSSFHVSVGVMFNQNELVGTANQTGDIIIDGNHIPFTAVGTLHGKVEQQPVNPYLSIGGNFFYFDKARHWALGGELGVVYTGEPTATVSAGRTGPVADRAARYTENRLEDYADKFKWLPILKLAVTYSF